LVVASSCDVHQMAIERSTASQAARQAGHLIGQSFALAKNNLDRAAAPAA
jgi:hypothetical protein